MKKIVKTTSRVERSKLVEEMSTFVCNTEDKLVCCEISEKNNDNLSAIIFPNAKETIRRAEIGNSTSLNHFKGPHT